MKGLENKEGKNSKTKIGAVLVGAGTVLTTVGNMVLGNVSFADGVLQLLPQIGTVLAVFGIRDIPILNNIKVK